MDSDDVLVCLAKIPFITQMDLIKWYTHSLGTNIFLNISEHHNILPLSSTKNHGLLTSEADVSFIYNKYSLLFVVDLKETTGCVSLRFNMTIREKIIEILKKYMKYVGKDLKLTNNYAKHNPMVNVSIILFRPQSTYKDYTVLLANYYIKDQSNYLNLSIVLEEKLTEYWTVQQLLYTDKTKTQMSSNSDSFKSLVTHCIRFSCNLPPDTHKRIILLTDGMCNFESSDAKDIQEVYEKYKSIGITFSLVFVSSCRLTPAGQTILKNQDFKTLPIGFIPYIPPYYYALNCCNSGYSQFIFPDSDEKADELEAIFQKLAFWHKVLPGKLKSSSNEELTIDDPYYLNLNGSLKWGRGQKTYSQDLMCAQYISSSALDKLLYSCLSNGFSFLTLKKNEKRRSSSIKLAKPINYQTFLMAKLNIISNESQEINFSLAVVSSDKYFFSLKKSPLDSKYLKGSITETSFQTCLGQSNVAERYEIQTFLKKFENILDLLDHFNNPNYYDNHFESRDSQFYKLIFEEKQHLFSLCPDSNNLDGKTKYRLNEEKFYFYNYGGSQDERCGDFLQMQNFIKYWRPILPMLNDHNDDIIRCVATIKSIYLILKFNVNINNRAGMENKLQDLCENLLVWSTMVLVRNKAYIKRAPKEETKGKEEITEPLFFLVTIETNFMPVIHIKVHTFPPYANGDATEKEVDKIVKLLQPSSMIPQQQSPYYFIKSHNFPDLFLNYGNNCGANVMELNEFPMSLQESMGELNGQNLSPSFPRQYLHCERLLIPIAIYVAEQLKTALDLFEMARKCLIEVSLDPKESFFNRQKITMEIVKSNTISIHGSMPTV